MKKNMSFEEAMTALEGAVSRLENGSLTLEESISTFEEAVGLIKECNKKLADAEQRVRILTEQEDGSITDKAFDGIKDET